MMPALREPLGDGSILIVEDDPGLAQLISSRLEANGFDCSHAATGTVALKHLDRASPSLMIVDYCLPDMTGLELVTTLLPQAAPPPPFIMITGREDTRLAVSIMQHGARDYLVKDLDFLERLPAVVARTSREVATENSLKEAEQALRESEARLAKAQRIARMGSWEWDPLTGKVYCSQGMNRLLGLAPGQTPTLERLAACVHQGDFERVRTTLETFLHTGTTFNIDFCVLREDGREIVVNAQGEVECNPDGTPRILSGTMIDITERKQAENEIQQLAYYDTLTRLPNRTLLRDRLGQAIAQAHRDGRLVGVLFLDLDGFKAVNDTLGHLNGDRLLKTVAKRLVEVVRESDTVARIGGDEFVIVLNAIVDEEDIGDIAGKILTALSRTVQLEKNDVFTTGSIGISVFPMDGDNAHLLLKNADLAMYRAKELEKNNYQFFSQEMNLKFVERLMLENKMRRTVCGRIAGSSSCRSQ